MVKWTTPEPVVGLSESDSKLYTNFEFCEEINDKQLKKTHWSTNQAICVDKSF